MLCMSLGKDNSKELISRAMYGNPTSRMARTKHNRKMKMRPIAKKRGSLHVFSRNLIAGSEI